MATKKIVHLRLKTAANGTNTDLYFGSLKAIYENVPEDLIGIKYRSLTNALRSKNTYENKLCVIKTGTLITKRQTNKHQSE